MVVNQKKVKRKKKLDEEVLEETSRKDDLKQEELDNTSIEEKKVSSKKWYKIILIILLIVSVLGLTIFIAFPRIELQGNKSVSLSYKDSYVELGYHGYVINKDITDNVKVISNVSDGVVGDYKIDYVIDFFGFEIKETRGVNIIDDVKPIINVDSDVIKVCPHEEIPDFMYEAIDEYDGDITSWVEKVVKEDSVLLSVTDSSNNLKSLNIKIDRVDDSKPEIKLKGSSVMFVTYGNSYYEPGYSANDNCDGDITGKVVISGIVGRDIGTYTLKYEVSDESGNTSSVTRKVIVGAKVSDNGSIHNGTIYLTFDDGPNSGTTDKILDILKEEGVQATFFVTCKGPDNLIKRMYDEGHTVAMHTASHDYSYVYSSVDNYFNDLNRVSDRVKNITGVDSKIIRFPGGSSNTVSRNYNKGIMTELTNIVLSKGYRYFDWNVDGKDASSARNSSDVYYNVTSNLSMNRANVVLLHDIKNITVGALRDIIKFGKEYGYTFSEIKMDTYMVRHGVNN